MDFTREPIIETVITPREGYRLVVRSSKGAGYEEHFVEALEVVSFGTSVFFRCVERPKPFIVPVADYEVLEVREPRMVLKAPSEQGAKAAREKPRQQEQAQRADHNRADSNRAESNKTDSNRAESIQPQAGQESPQPQNAQEPREGRTDGRPEGRPEGGRSDRRRDRRRGFRRRRGQGRDDQAAQEPTSLEEIVEERVEQMTEGEGLESKLPSTTPMLSSILPPPTSLIRDDLQKYREKEEFKGAFYLPGEKDKMSDDDESTLSSLGTSDEELAFREAPYDISEEDIRMSEGGDQEVSQDEPFRSPPLGQEANTSSSQDVQNEVN